MRGVAAFRLWETCTMPVVLRPLESADAPRIQQLVSDPRLAAWANLPRPYPPDGAERFLQFADGQQRHGTGRHFAIERFGLLVGVLSVGCGVDPGPAMLGYWIGVPWQGLGVASQALEQLLKPDPSAAPGLRTWGSVCLERNLASRRVLEKNGFTAVAARPYEGPYPHRFGGQTCLTYLRMPVANAVLIA